MFLEASLPGIFETKLAMQLKLCALCECDELFKPDCEVHQLKFSVIIIQLWTAVEVDIRFTDLTCYIH